MLHRFWAIAAFVCLCGIYVHGLPKVGLLGPDEPRYASIGREMARSGDWVTPRLWGETWFEKPALLYWMVASAYKAGLGDAWAPRIGVALVSLVFLAFYYMQLRREFGDAAGAYATAFLATSAGWFAFSQVGVTDLPMAAAFAASMLLALRWVRSGGRRGLLLAGGLLGVAVLAKGLVPVVLAAPLLVVGRRRWRDLFVYAAGCVAVAAPWYVLCYRWNGWAFVDEFFIEHHFGRFASETLQHVQPWWFYLPVLLAGLFPWTPFLAFVWRRNGARDGRRLLLLASVVWGLVFFSGSTNKLPGYVLPLLPLIAALIGIHVAEAKRFGLVLALSALLVSAVPAIAAILPPALDRGLSRASAGGVPLGGLVPGIVLALTAWWLAEHGRRALATGLVAVAVGGSILYLQSATYPALERQVSARGLWVRLHPPCVDSGGLRRSTWYGLNFYAGSALPECAAERRRSSNGS